MSSDKTRAARRSWAKGLLASGDCCGLCERWEFTVQAAGGAPAVGDCTAEYIETLRTASAKPCERFERDAMVEEEAYGDVGAVMLRVIEAAARGGKETA